MPDHPVEGARRVHSDPRVEPCRLCVDRPGRLAPVRCFATAIALDADAQGRLQCEDDVLEVESADEVPDLGLPVEVPVEHHRGPGSKQARGASARDLVGLQEFREPASIPEIMILQDAVDGDPLGAETPGELLRYGRLADPQGASDDDIVTHQRMVEERLYLINRAVAVGVSQT